MMESFTNTRSVYMTNLPSSDQTIAQIRDHFPMGRVWIKYSQQAKSTLNRLNHFAFVAFVAWCEHLIHTRPIGRWSRNCAIVWSLCTSTRIRSVGLQTEASYYDAMHMVRCGSSFYTVDSLKMVLILDVIAWSNCDSDSRTTLFVNTIFSEK